VLVIELASGDVKTTVPLEVSCLGLALIQGSGLGAIIGTPGKIRFEELS
jgi:hypothetical protein